MYDDLLEGVRAAREAFAASHGYELGATLRRLNEAGDRVVVRLPPRRVATNTPPNRPLERIPADNAVLDNEAA